MIILNGIIIPLGPQQPMEKWRCYTPKYGLLPITPKNEG